MARLMSVSQTVAAVELRQKTVTRRLGWRFLRAGDQLQLCRKVQGRKRGEPLHRIAMVEVVSVHREPLQYISRGDVVREGFPHMTRDQFLDFYTTTFGVDRGTWVTRIEWRYLDNRSGS